MTSEKIQLRQPRQAASPAGAFFRQRRVILLLIGLSAVVAILSTYASYYGGLSSSAWRCWGKGTAWMIDSIRVVGVAAITASLFLWPFSHNRSREHDPFSLRADRWTIAWAITFFVAIAMLNFAFYPPAFAKSVVHNGCATEAEIEQNYFNLIYRPYFVYFFYSLCMWCGMILPTFLFFTRGLRHDIDRTQSSIESLERLAIRERLRQSADSKVMEQDIDLLVVDVRVMKEKIEAQTRVLAQRWVPAILLVFVGHTTNIFIMSGTNENMNSSMTAAARSSNSWVIFIYSAICLLFFARIASLLSRQCAAIGSSIDRICAICYEDKSVSPKKNGELLDIRDKWLAKHDNILLYAFDIVIKSRHVYIPLLVFITHAIWVVIAKDRAIELLPPELVSALRRIFLRH